jgi:ppGpp synthetase/RelA/SpoT-type nucleotidyltranferase
LFALSIILAIGLTRPVTNSIGDAWFLTPYKQAVDELKVKLKGMRKQYEVGEQASPIEYINIFNKLAHHS